MKLKKALFVMFAIFAAGILFSCKPAIETPETPTSTKKPETKPEEKPVDTEEKPVEPEMPPLIKPDKNNKNPSPTGSRYFDLNFIFNNQTLGKTTLKVRRSEWNQLLRNYDYFYKNENCVHGITYTYEKDGYTWEVPNFGFRLRGNTSRFRPQGKDSPEDETGHRMPNGDWSTDYYNYAANCSDDDYRQSHFKVDFEEWLEDPDEFKMSGCMKGVALKRMDSSCTREIMCYDLFKKFGIWTAPRASHTRVIFEFVEDVDKNGSIIEDISSCEKTTVDFGVYEMFEEVNKQSLKAREQGNNKAMKHTNYWANNKGNLWKCAGGDLTNPNANFNVEKNEITKFADDGTPLEYVWDQPTYDLKTNKDKLEEAKTEFSGFIRDLNALPSKADTESEINEIKAFYEKWFDVEFFLKSYAVNILCGMDDDYWANANNYYLYFDTGKKGTGKVYFIPFDYDNTLGNSIKSPGILQNPLDWGRGANRPLMDKILLVPEYRAMFKNLLKEVSSADGPWNFEACSAQFIAWGDMVRPYLDTPNIKGWPNIATKDWNGGPGYQNGGLALTSNPNLYDATRESFLRWITDIKKITFDLNGGNIDGKTSNIVIDSPEKSKELSSLTGTPKRSGYIFAGWTTKKNGDDYVTYATEEYVYARWKKLSEITDLMIYEIEDDSYEGIKIGILNVPEDAGIRNVYIDGMIRGDLGLDNGQPNPKVTQTEWAYPFTQAGKEYKIYVEYQNKDYRTVGKTNTLTIKATSGKGEFYVANKPNYKVENNILKFNPEPILFIGGRSSVSEEDWKNNKWAEYFALSLSSSIGWLAWDNIGYSCSGYNFAEHINDYVTTDTSLKFTLYYLIGSEYGSYRLDLYNEGQTDGIKLQTKNITFNLNGGNINGSTDSITKTTPVKSESLSSFVDTPKWAGHIFRGWTTTKNGDTIVETTSTAMPYDTVYAKWISYEDLKDEITDLFIYEIDDDSYDGIKIGILNVPAGDDVSVRNIYVNDKQVAREDVYNATDRNLYIKATEWGFPYTKAGEKYEIYIRYQTIDSNYGWHDFDGNTSNKITITAKKGLGEFHTINDTPNFEVKNNILSFTTLPEYNQTISGDYEMELRIYGGNWYYQSSGKLDLSEDKTKFNMVSRFTQDENGRPKQGDTMDFTLRYVYKDSNHLNYGRYWYVLYGWDDERTRFTVAPYTWGEPNKEIDFYIEQINDGYEGIKLSINNLPKETKHYAVYINDVDCYHTDLKESKNMVWCYPYVKNGQTYKIRVDAKGETWNYLGSSNTISVTATSGLGNWTIDKPDYTRTGDVITFDKTNLQMYLDGIPISINDLDNDYHSYVLTLESVQHHYQSDFYFDHKDELSEFDISKNLSADNPAQRGDTLSFYLKFEYRPTTIDDNVTFECYKVTIYSHEETKFIWE